MGERSRRSITTLSTRARRKAAAPCRSLHHAHGLVARASVESGGLTPVIDRTSPLARIVEAHAHVATGRNQGNVVLTID
jgi:NADPH:quinone reductase-like Zn-dependent oxidoreductase